VDVVDELVLGVVGDRVRGDHGGAIIDGDFAFSAQSMAQRSRTSPTPSTCGVVHSVCATWLGTFWLRGTART